MNFIVQLGGSRTWTIFQEYSTENQPNVSNQNVTFRAKGFNGWTQFWSVLKSVLNQYPSAKVFISASPWGRSPYIEGTFKIIWNNPQNRNEGMCLQRKEGSNWVNVVSDSTDAKAIFEQLNLIANNGTDEHKIAVAALQIQFEPNYWITI